MQFRHPELLYALLLLIIPILVHLFELRRFKEERFTNVAFLKKIQIQTRKSNTIKKWIILFTRMMAMALIVLAFAQPFFTQYDSATRERETVIYLDNSFSMQAKGPSGQLLRTAIQELITVIPKEEKVTLLTNTDTYRQRTIGSMRNALLQLSYTPVQLSDEAILLKATKEFTTHSNTVKRLIYISDFQGNNTINLNDTLIQKHYVQLEPVLRNNVYVDSMYVSSRKAQGLELTVLLSTQVAQETNTAVSLYNGNTLLAKGTASFDENIQTQVVFDIKNEGIVDGKVVIEDPLLSFDNTLYFSINSYRPIKVLAINGGSSTYLSRIFTSPEFDFRATAVNNLDFSSIPNYNYIVLNEVEEISLALVEALSSFSKSGGIITMILNPEGDLMDYTQSVQQLANIRVTDLNRESRLVTTINYGHPIFSDVFENQIKNFQYPSVSNSFNIQGGDPILQFEDGTPFLVEREGIYIMTTSISDENSNFKNSPLIVPTFYNMSRQSLRIPKLYVTTGKTNSYDIAAVLQKDDIVHLQELGNPKNNLIPLQQIKGNKVSITTTQDPSIAGNYEIKQEDSLLQQISYNYSRDESLLLYRDLKKLDVESYQTSVAGLFTQLQSQDTVQSLWKWFVIFALFFLLLEILILKFVK